MKKPRSIDRNRALPLISILALILIWAGLSASGWIPAYMLPSPLDVVKAFIADWPALWDNSKTTLYEAALGLVISIVGGFLMALLMDRHESVNKALYPLMVLTQTVPPIAMAPLLVLWFGFGISPKVILIVIVCFFPITVGFLDGFAAAGEDEIRLLRSMGATRRQVFRHVKLPTSLPHFFAGLKVSSSYCIVSAVIAEWLGGTEGLGVYMTRVRKSYAFDKMFAVIILISILSLLLMWLVTVLQKRAMPYRQKEDTRY